MRRLQTLPTFAILALLLTTTLAACNGSTPGAPTIAPTIASNPGVPTVGQPSASNPTPTLTRARPSDTTHPTGTGTPVPPTAALPATVTPPPKATLPAGSTPSPTAATRPAQRAGFTLDIEPVAQEFKRPLFVTNAGDGSNRLFVVEQPGRIFILENGKRRPDPFLDIRDRVTTTGNEQGLLGLAFHPDYKSNGLLYIYYSRKTDNDNVVVQYHVSADPNVVDANSATTLLEMEGLEPNHNGGMLAFGPDKYLYIGTGDGGGGGDNHGPTGNGQALDKLLGKILRIQVGGAGTYSIPPGNPFANQSGARPEVWAYGYRNPWRFSFDRATGDLYVADVGQGKYEEIDFQPASSKGGENYGWRIMEGNHCYNPANNCDSAGLVKPVFEYSHDLGCSVTGGYIYRGNAYPWLVGQYIFADYCTGIVWAMSRQPNGAWQTRQVTRFDDTISSFGQDEAGEIYVVGHSSGTVYKLVSSQ